MMSDKDWMKKIQETEDVATLNSFRDALQDHPSILSMFLNEKIGRLVAEEKVEGSYYITIEELFCPEDMIVQDDDFNLLKRTRDQRPDVYQTLSLENEDAQLISRRTEAMVSDTSLNTEVRSRLYPMDIFGNRANGDVAHLIPNSPSCAVFFDDVAEWALGLAEDRIIEVQTVLPNLRRKHLSQRAAYKKFKRMAVVGYKQNKKKKQNSALKQHPQNKIRLNSQAMYFDAYPCLLLVPLMELSDVINWNGRSFDAIAVVGSFEGKEKKSARVVANAIDMSRNTADDLSLQNSAELRKATLLLQSAVRALASSMKVRDARDFEECKMYREELKHTWTHLSQQGTIKVPQLMHSHLDQRPRVRKITLEHTPPDPLLLVVKSAVVWSCRWGQRLLPACPEMDDSWSEGDQILAEMALEQQREALRLENQLDMAAALGQS